jgi:hypothetical protein
VDGLAVEVITNVDERDGDELGGNRNSGRKTLSWDVPHPAGLKKKKR